MNQICKYCGKPTSEHSMIFYPDGMVEETCRRYVSVPVAFVEAVHELIKREIILGVQRDGIEVKILTMLTEIEKGGGG